MAFASVFSRAQNGIDATLVTVEAHVSGGQGFILSGLPETAVREARERVRSALINNGFEFPDNRIVIHLAPADVVKSGGRFDLAIAISLLAATRQVPDKALAKFEFLGELGLSGTLRGINGALCALLAIARDADNDRQLIVPSANAGECVLSQSPVSACHHLAEVVGILRNQLPARSGPKPLPRRPRVPRLEPIIGQAAAKRALLIAATGGHHMLMIGPPGTGKTLLARRLSELMPDLPEPLALEVAAIYSALGTTREEPNRPPFRDPHHSASGAALVGGGSNPRPGEITLAHQGVLFLDELPEFRRDVLDQLREPLESRTITIARARHTQCFPSNFQLVTAMNPCPAGRVCSEATCRCTGDQVRRYQSRLSGPLLDRIDLHVQVPQLNAELLTRINAEAPVDIIRARDEIGTLRAEQRERQGALNAHIRTADLNEICHLADDARDILERAARSLNLSARSVHRIMKVARTIADLNHAAAIDRAHLSEAIGYRALDWDATVR